MFMYTALLAGPAPAAGSPNEGCGGSNAFEELEILRSRFSADDRRECLEYLIEHWEHDPGSRPALVVARHLLARHSRRGPAFAVWSQTQISPVGFPSGGGITEEIVFGLSVPFRKPGHTRDSSLLVYWGVGGGSKHHDGFWAGSSMPVGLGEIIAVTDGRGNRVGLLLAQGVTINFRYSPSYWSQSGSQSIWLEYDLQASLVIHDRRDFLFSAGFRIAAGPGFATLLPGIVIRVGAMEFLP